MPFTTKSTIHYFLTVEITLKEGQRPNFIEYAEKLLSFMKDTLHWRLIAACSSVTGIPNTVFHLWELPDANSLLDGMVRLADNNDYSKLLECCEKQTQRLFTSMPYNPQGINLP